MPDEKDKSTPQPETMRDPETGKLVTTPANFEAPKPSPTPEKGEGE